MKPYLSPSDKNLCGGVGGEGGWKNDDYHMYHEHDDHLFASPAHSARAFVSVIVFPTSGPTSGLLNRSHLDEITSGGFCSKASLFFVLRKENAYICFWGGKGCFNHFCPIALLSL